MVSTSDCLPRRKFLAGITLAATSLVVRAFWAHATDESGYDLVARVDHHRILAEANRYLDENPVTVTSTRSERSAGGLHDYFSEGDYWWPNPKDPGGPYIRRDGYSNPGNFSGHRAALMRLSVIVPALVGAWCLTRDKRYSSHAVQHLRAWFVDPATVMNPNLEYAQAIFGVTKGRGIGIIDTLQLVEVVRAARVLQATDGITLADVNAVRTWFASYVAWMTTSKNGKDEEMAKNNHGTCWVLQVAEFSQFSGRSDLTAFCRERFRHVLVPNQIASNGSLPLELARTKPFSYSLFDTDVLCGICQSLSTPKDNLWTFKGPNGAGIGDAVGFLFPYMLDKTKWPFAKDVEHFDAQPSRRPSLLFAGEALHRPRYIALWKRLNGDVSGSEIIRNLPIRQPLLWVSPVLQA